MKHRELLHLWPSAAAMSDDTGFSIDKCKRLRRIGWMRKPDDWLTIVRAAAKGGLITNYSPGAEAQICYGLVLDADQMPEVVA